MSKKRAVSNTSSGNDDGGRAVLYARVSGDDRHNEGRNLAGQIDMGREYAGQRGYAVVADLSEDERGGSGAAFELPQLNCILQMAEAGEFDVLVVREIDRLSRNLAKHLIVEEKLRRAGVRIEYVLGEYPDTPEGQLNKHLHASVAEYERLKIIERNTRGKALKVKSGSVMLNGQRTYGYQRVEKDGKWALVIDKAEARIVQMIFEWYANGDGTGARISMYRISDRLTDMGVPTAKSIQNGTHGAIWSRRTINNILTNETYAGVWRYHRDDSTSLTVTVPAIIERGLWERVQQRKDENRRTLRQQGKGDFLLSGMLTCGECERGMTGMTSEKREGKLPRRYYRCNAASNGLQLAKPCGNTHYFNADDVEAGFWGWIKSFLLDDGALERGLADYQYSHDQTTAPIRSELRTIDKLLKAKEAELERATDDYLAKGGNRLKVKLAQRATQLEAEIVSLERQRGKLAAALQTEEITAERVQSLRQFRASIAADIETIDRDLPGRRGALEALEAHGILRIENGEKVLQAHCLFGSKTVPLLHHSRTYQAPVRVRAEDMR